MKSSAASFLMLFMVSVLAFGQGRAPQAPPPTNMVAPNIPGVVAFDVRPDGTLANRRNFGKYQSVRIPDSKDRLLAEDNGADGLAVDSEGRVYAATNLGAEVFSPQGKHLGAIPIIWGGETFNLKKPANLAFSGPDKKTLYAVGAGAVFKVQMLAQGFKGRAK